MKQEHQEMMATYEAPKVEVIEVQVEKGFAGSDITPYTPGEGWS